MQTANQTRQLAADTLEELNRQGEKLDKVDRDLTDVRTAAHASICSSKQSRACCLTRTPPEGLIEVHADSHGCQGGKGYPQVYAALLLLLRVLVLLRMRPRCRPGCAAPAPRQRVRISQQSLDLFAFVHGVSRRCDGADHADLQRRRNMMRQTDVEIGEMERRRQVAQNGNVQVQQASMLRASPDLATH